MRLSKWRFAAGLVALFLLLIVAARLLPPYWRNIRFQRALEQTVQTAQGSSPSDDALRVNVLAVADRLGLPVRPEGIRVKRSRDRVGVEVLYVVPVQLPLYAVDLHFRPSAGGP